MSFTRSRIATYLIAVVWILFGLLGKLVPITPTHIQIVARVFGVPLSEPITTLIGFGELLIALWVISGKWRAICGWLQIALVVIMNCIELTIARDLLLWGPLNGFFALIFVVTVYLHMVAPRRATGNNKAADKV
jgi:hypothetical protein